MHSFRRWRRVFVSTDFLIPNFITPFFVKLQGPQLLLRLFQIRCLELYITFLPWRIPTEQHVGSQSDETEKGERPNLPSLCSFVTLFRSCISLDPLYMLGYTTKGLSCSLCSIPIKHEQLWSAHLTSKGHRAAVQQAVIQKQQEESRKRALEPSPEPAEESNKKPRTENDDLPEGFFDDPNQAPQASTSAVEPVVEEEEDEEWAAFERDVLADSVADGPTISAPAQLLEEKEEGKEEVKALQKRDGVTGEVIEDRPDETEEERRDREEREELMSRIDECVSIMLQGSNANILHIERRENSKKRMRELLH